MRIKTYLTLVCLSFCAWHGLNSQTQYIGPDNGDWFTAANWNNGLPANGNDALIGGGINVVIGSPLTIDFTITNFGGVTANSPLVNDGTISNSGTFNFSGTSGLTNNGAFNNFNSSTFDGSSTFVNETGASFTNGGTFTLSTVLTNRGLVTNNGTIDAAAGTLVTEGSFDNSQTLTTESLTVAAGSTFTNNFGSNLNITGASALLQVDGNFNNLGTVTATGDFNVNGNFSNSSAVVTSGSLTIAAGAVFNNASGIVTNDGAAQNLGTFINGFQLVNNGSFINDGTFNNNNLIDISSTGSFTNSSGSSIAMGFGSKIQNAGTLVTNGSIDSFGNIENSGSFTNGGTINSFSGSQINNLVGSFTNDGTISTNDQVNTNADFFNNGVINVNGGSVWMNNGNFTINISGSINNQQDFQNKSAGALTNNGRFTNFVRTLNEGIFTNNAYLENMGIFTNETGSLLTNNELLQQVSGNILNSGALENTDFLLSDECSTISNDGTINNTGSLEVHAIIFQRGTLSGTAVDCQGCYVHTNTTSDAPAICQDGTFGADIDGEVKVYAPELIAFANFDSCANFVYLADGIDRPVFTCSDIGTIINANIVLRVPNTTDSLTCTASITPTDVLEPQFDSCPRDIVVFSDQAGVVVDWVEPVFTDNCTASSVTNSHSPGDNFPFGITGVTYSATDDYGNIGNCQFRVDVRQTPLGAGCTGDATAPVFVGCPTDITLVTTGTGANASWVAPTATDDCYPLFLDSDFVPGQLFGVGTTAVIYTATDGNGNEGTCSFDVIVDFEDPCAVDNTPPSFINCPANIFKPIDAATGGAVAVWVTPNVFDLCGVASVSASHISGSVFLAGTTNVVYTADDVNGNSSTCNFTITVGNDPCPGVTTPPVFNNCPANITVQANGNSAVVNWTEPTASSSCQPITITSNFSPGATFQLGQTTVIYQASDVKGNTSTCSFTVTVEGNCTVDNEPPVISNCPADITVGATNGSGTATWTEPTASDNCALISFSSTFSPGASFPVGVTTVIYTAGDLSGNGSTCEFNVTVVNAPACTTNAAPIDQTTDVDPASVDLSWNSSLDASAYDVFLGTANPPSAIVAADVSGTSTTVNGLQGGTTYYWYVVPKNVAGSATGCSSSATSFSTSGSTGSGCNFEALFVASSTSLNTSDANAKARLEALGFNVTVVDDNQTTTADADGKGLIFISSTTLSSNVNTKYRDVAVPVICYESWLFDDFNMTGSTTGTDYDSQGSLSQLTIENASHPLAAGLSGTVQVYSSSNTMSWGVPSASAISIASVPGNSTRKLIFAYDTGDNMVGLTAPARRVGFFLHNSTANLLTINGSALFDAAVQWAVGIQPPGTPCNDGNPNTENDVILADGCTCQGTLCTGAFTGLSFFDINAGTSTINIVDGGTYLLSDLPASYNILASTTGTLESVQFDVSGALVDTHIENVVPYHYPGDPNPLALTAGSYTFVVTVYSQDVGAGIICDQQTVSFTLEDEVTCSPVGQNIQVDGGAFNPGTSVAVCEGQDVVLDFDGNGYEQWVFVYSGPNGFSQTNTGSSTSDQLLLADIILAQGGVYNVDYTDPQGCTLSTSFTVNVTAGDPIAVCSNLTLQQNFVGETLQITGNDVDGGSSPGCNGTITSLDVSPNSFSQPGNHTVTLTVTNSLGLTADCQATVTIIDPPQAENCSNGIDDDGDGLIDCNDPDCAQNTVTISSRINKGSDDAEELIVDGDVSRGSSDLEFVYDGGDQLVGMRFENISVPQGAAIINAYIEFETDETNSTTTNLVFKGEDNDNTLTFSSIDYDISNRPTTSASVAWNNVPAWNTTSQKHQTPDLSPIVQEIVNRGGWVDGNSLVIIVSGTGERTAESYNGESANAPLLVIEYGDCNVSTCDNITDGGEIEKTCQGSQVVLVNDDLPTGGTGDIEYLWISGTLDCDPDNMSPVSGAGSTSELTINSVSQTTYFLRCSRRAGCTDWDGESNCIIVQPNECNIPSPSCDGNLYVNGGFEDGIGGATWYNNIGITATDVYSGSQALSICGGWGEADQYLAALGGETYTLNVFAKKESGAGWSGVGIVYYDENWNELGREETEITSTGFQEYTVQVSLPSQARRITTWIYKGDGGCLYADDFCLTSSGPSTECSSNLLANLNGNFENNLDEWDWVNNAVITTSDVYEGNNSVQVCSGQGGGGNQIIAVPGAVYTLNVAAKVTGNPDWAGVGIKFYDSDWQRIGSDHDRGVTATIWTNYIVQVEAPSNAAYVETYFWKDNNGCLKLDEFCLTASGGNSGSSPILQTGEIVIEQANSSTWYWVSFDQPFDNTPIVILGPPSANSTDQVIPRIRNVNTNGFEFQIDEWDYLNGYHPIETLFYMAMESGNHTIGGVNFEAGNITANASFSTYNFDVAFSSRPIVLTTVASYNDANAVGPRTRNVGNSSFQFKLHEEDNSSHSNETVAYIAMTQGSFSYNGDNFKSGLTSNSVTHNWYTVNFSSSFSNPGFLASFDTYDGGDVCALRHRNLNTDNVQIKVEEEQWLDSEVSHTTEAIGWLVFSTSSASNLAAQTAENLQLEAVKELEHAALYWTHNEGFKVGEYILEKSVDGGEFEPITALESLGSNRTEVYEGYDFEPVVGENIYRVRLVHLDGTVSYSATRTVRYDDLIDFLLFPNPANDFVTVNLEAIVGKEDVSLTIYNNLGVLVDQVDIDRIYSKYYQVDLRKMKEGHYIIWLNIPEHKPVAKQLVIGKL